MCFEVLVGECKLIINCGTGNTLPTPETVYYTGGICERKHAGTWMLKHIQKGPFSPNAPQVP